MSASPTPGPRAAGTPASEPELSPAVPVTEAMESPPAGEYVITPGELAPGWLMLYAATFAAQFLCGMARWVLAFPCVWLVLAIAGEPTAPAQALAVAIGFGPLVLSLATLVLPLGGWLSQARLGGRAPSQRERLIFEDALAALRGVDPDVRPPHRWFVLDEPLCNASAYADTLMLTRGLLESGQTEAVLAHELGHLNSSDARLTAALHRMTTPPRRRLRFPLRTLGFVLSGAAAGWLTRAPWAAYWRQREFQADAYAARLGQGEGLAGFLETNALEGDLPVPFVWLSEHSHPPTEHRIERLG